MPKCSRGNGQQRAVGEHCSLSRASAFFGVADTHRVGPAPPSLRARTTRPVDPTGEHMIRQFAFALIFVVAPFASAQAQTYPSRPITIVAPFPAGGATDIVSRTLAEGMKAPLGQTILVENVTGASGTIGSGRVVRAEPDGYTLVIGQWSSHVGAGALYRLP